MYNTEYVQYVQNNTYKYTYKYTYTKIHTIICIEYVKLQNQKVNTCIYVHAKLLTWARLSAAGHEEICRFDPQILLSSG